MPIATSRTTFGDLARDELAIEVTCPNCGHSKTIDGSAPRLRNRRIAGPVSAASNAGRWGCPPSASSGDGPTGWPSMPASSAKTDRPRQTDLFGIEPALPEGLLYREGAISADEERHYAQQFRLLPFAPFEFHGFLGRRRVVSFGWRYDYGKQRLREANPLPDLLLPLRRRAAEIAGLPVENLKQALVTEYDIGAAIGWHRDKPMFAEVVALSFLSPCRLRFRRRRPDGWERRALDVQPRSIYVLRGAARQDWEHSIPPVESLRYSVTFRTLRS